MSPIAHETVGAELGELLLDRVRLEVSASADESDAFRAGLEELLRSRTEPLKTWLDAALAGDSAGVPCRERAHELIRWLRKRNQFVVFDGPEAAQVEAFFAGLFAQIRSLLELGAEEHSARARSLELEIAAFVRSLPPGAALEVPSANYSASLQLEVLGIDLQQLQEPILDLGCGNPPLLLLSLKQAGLDAVGIDRDGGEAVLTADWLEHEFSPETWGSILSHLAFSLHFLHHHLGRGAGAAAYAKKYVELLRALRPSGTFVYVPGLPFIERLLPTSEYRVSRSALKKTLAEGLAPFARALGEPVSYACRVERLGSDG